ncbi:ATP-dependent DNA helicase Rep [hydrothermal vent metagenome]|uniref:DNA 3'-5' helicase n=1 Tax=hydrothermal vent metagenome TaxID=652676 RepID=A0A3B0YJ34_9ZZZZ
MREVQTPLLVLAGAGSGKTRVITEKIAYLVGECQVNARNIFAVTFTNKAAREMRERVNKLLKKDTGRGLVVSTFHTLGMRMLRREASTLGYKSNFSIFDSQDSLHLIDEILRKGTSAYTSDTLRNRISDWKNDLVLPLQAVKQANTEFEQAAALLYAEYQRSLKAYNALDFDDLILQPVLALQEHESTREHWQNRVRHLLVDEYQDTNTAQYQLVQLLVGKTTPFTAVGDDDQSIYAWRGANPENLNRLKDDFPRLQVVKLEQNYRSAGCILKCANQLIANNPHVFEKRLWSSLGYGSPIKILSCRDGDHEAERVVSEILHHQFTRAGKHGDYAILYRGNHQSRSFEKVLREHSIAYHLSGGTSFFEYTEVKDLMAYLRLLVNEDDDRAFLRVVNTPRRELGAATLEKLAAYAAEFDLSLLGACFESGLESVLNRRASSRLREFAEWIVSLADQAKRGEPMPVVQQLIHDIDYSAWLVDNAKEPQDADRRQQNVNDMLDWLERLANKDEKQRDLAEIVSRIALLDRLDRDDEGNSNCVRLMTFHAAKGLEFPHVFLVGMEENLLPHRSSIEADDFDEERRLAYVGITRAQKTLTLTYANKRRRAGQWESCEPSRFLAELPQDDLEWDRPGKTKTPEARKQRGQAHLAQLRGMLN